MNIWDAFEVPTLEDQRNLPQIESLHKLRIAESELGLNPTTFNLDHPRLSELIREHNNKVGNLIMTYTLAYHYFSAGIPDDRWYQSPGKKGQSVQYMPDFSEEHWGAEYLVRLFLKCVLHDDFVHLGSTPAIPPTTSGKRALRGKSVSAAPLPRRTASPSCATTSTGPFPPRPTTVRNFRT